MLRSLVGSEMCIRDRPCICETQEMLKMLKTYTQTCEDVAKFSFTMLNQAHDDMNMLFMIEDEILGKKVVSSKKDLEIVKKMKLLKSRIP